MPAAIVRRLARWVSSGPVVPALPVPRTAWQAPQPAEVKTARPASDATCAGAASAASQRSKSAAGITSTSNRICAWAVPQNSAQLPPQRPGSSGVSVIRLVRPGIRSILPPRAGAQKLWITPVEASASPTVRPAGRRISFAVTTRPAGVS